MDPVKINSLEEFGTPEQVAERVLAVERTRDGVKSVTLRQVPAPCIPSRLRRAHASHHSTARHPTAPQVASEPGPPSYYVVEYLTDSSRGIKVYRCKYCIAQQR